METKQLTRVLRPGFANSSTLIPRGKGGTMLRRMLRLGLALIALTAIVGGASQVLAGKPGGGGGGGCPQPRVGCFCYDLYAPVTCDGGCTYTNQCFADCAGAQHCVGSGPGPIL